MIEARSANHPIAPYRPSIRESAKKCIIPLKRDYKIRRWAQQIRIDRSETSLLRRSWKGGRVDPPHNDLTQDGWSSRVIATVVRDKAMSTALRRFSAVESARTLMQLLCAAHSLPHRAESARLGWGRFPKAMQRPMQPRYLSPRFEVLRSVNENYQNVSIGKQARSAE